MLTDEKLIRETYRKCARNDVAVVAKNSRSRIFVTEARHLVCVGDGGQHLSLFFLMVDGDMSIFYSLGLPRVSTSKTPNLS